jgi:hypothetical protein
VRKRVLVLVVVAGTALGGCGGGSASHDKSSASGSAPASGTTAGGTTASGTTAGGTTAGGTTAGVPLPTASPRGDSDAPTCTTISYRVTGAGVEVSAQVGRTPITLNFEADDADDNPVTGDPATSAVTYVFKGADTRHTLLIKGVKSLHHVSVIGLGTEQNDSCRAYPR